MNGLRSTALRNLAFLALCIYSGNARACTTIAFTPGSTADGSAYASSTADCLDCDFRLAKVPSRKYPAGTRRDVYVYKANYPHVVREGRSETWRQENLEGSRERIREWVSRSRKRRVGEVDEARKTYALIESGAGYGLLNEKMVGMGESTCLAKFVAAPIGFGGHALLDISELSQIALERASTARAAVLLMGELAEKYGYYGAEWDTPNKFDEAGENLMVTDPHEAWVFHILPDDTGRSAIWAAQRVPDGHITVVANQFIIRRIDSSDSRNFLHSANMIPIATKHGFHNPQRDGKHLDFTRSFSSIRPHSSYTTHRIYSVFTQADPTLVGKLDPYPSALMDGYPFSVKPLHPLTASDVFNLNRGHYEGTPWDMTKSAAAQPFGDPDRYDIGALGNFTTHQVAEAGEYGRAISIGRTSYTAVARSTRRLPAEVGAMLYFSQQQPDSSVFVPVYVAAEELPRELTVGSLFEFNPDSFFWSVTAVSNWVHRYYKHAIGELRKVQRAYETQFAVEETDAAAFRLMKDGRHTEARKVMSDFTKNAAVSAHKTYTKLLPKLIARFHDGFLMRNPEGVDVKMETMFYSLSWLKMSGYYSMSETGGGDKAVAPLGHVRRKPGEAVSVASSVNDLQRGEEGELSVSDSPASPSSGTFDLRWHFASIFAGGLAVGVAGTLGAVASAGLFAKVVRRQGYQEIS